jgi:DNA-binding beta-propeller fold protein YncE
MSSRWFIGASVAILSGSVIPAVAQPASIHGPVSGFVYSHGSRTIRPLLGISGASRIGSPVLNEVDFGSIGPDGKWALTTKDGRSSFTHGLADLAPTESSTDGLIDAVDRVVWNRDGSVALLYSSSTNQLQRARLSDTGVAADSPLDLSSWGPVTTLAVDPAGRQVAFGVSGSGLYLFAVGQSPALLSSMARPAAAAFDGTGQHLYAVDVDQQRISRFDSGSSASEFASLAQTDAPAVTPVGLAVSGDGRYLLLADSAAHAVRVYDTASGSLANTISLDFTPTRFEALSAAPTYLLNGDNSNEWLLVLDARQLPGVTFVPASVEVAQ